MHFEPFFYKMETKLIKTKLIVYGNQKMEIDYNILKSNSTFFRENDHLYSSSQEIHFLSEEKTILKIPESVVINFVRCCQNQNIEINSENIFYLNYLAKRYGVKDLEMQLLNIISQNKEKLALQSILFTVEMNQDKAISLVNTSNEENLISQFFEEFMENDQLLELPTSILYRITENYYHNQIENNNRNNQPRKRENLIKFLFRLFDKYGNQASMFLSFFEIDKQRANDLLKLNSKYSSILNLSYMNKSLMNTTVELIQEMIELKREFSKELEEMKQIRKEEHLLIQRFIEQQNKDKLDFEKQSKKTHNDLSNSINKTKNEITQELNKIKSQLNYQQLQIQALTAKQNTDKTEIAKQMNEKDLKLSNSVNEIKHQIKTISYIQQILTSNCEQSNIFEQHIKYLIPTGKKWEPIGPNNDHFKLKDSVLDVSSSKPYDSAHVVTNLFDGQKEIKGKNNVWASVYNETNAYIVIDFSKPVVSNIIKMTPRFDNTTQAPTHFEIFGLIDQKEESLKEVNVIWSSPKTKLFLFHNEKPYSKYKLQFYKFISHSGFAELNLGKFEYN